MSQNRVIALILFIVITLALVWWRWVYLSPQQLDLITVVETDQPAVVSPMDEVLKKHINLLTHTQTLLQQFKRPSESITLKPLWIDRCEVTQRDFRQFATWRAAQVIPPNAHPATPQRWAYKSQSENHRILGQLSMPAGGLSFLDGWAYCHAAGGRLPSSQEFEAISAGKEQRLYPWGNILVDDAWPYKDPSLNVAQVCGSHPATDTPEGIHDLGNNVLEWTTNNDQAVLMGGNAYHRPLALNAINLIRRSAPVDFRSQYTGFRCVYDRTQQANLDSLPLPWGSQPKIASIDASTLTIGPPKSAKIPALLLHLKDDQLKSIQNFSIIPTRLNLKVMRYEVTVASYTKFLRDPLVRFGFYNHPQQPVNMAHEPIRWDTQQQNPSHPVTNITWWNAWSFAKWVGGRLPTAPEWTALAGAHSTRFPYGNQYQPLASVDRNRIDSQWQSLEVIASNDDSKHAIKGFAGNVAEWTSTSLLRGNAFTLVIKGGSFFMPEEGGEIGQSGEAPPNYKNADLGFRVVFPN